MRYAKLVVALAILLAFAGCEKSASDQIVGTWKRNAYTDLPATVAAPETVIFTADGAVSWGGVGGRYSWIKNGESGTVLLTLGTATETYDVRFNGERSLSLTKPDRVKGTHYDRQ